MISYKKTKFEDEMDEFDRVVSEFSNGTDEDWDSKYSEVKKIYAKSTKIDLSELIWQKLENTDSYRSDTLEKIQKAVKSNTASSGKRDIAAVIKEYNSNSVRAPIILSYGDGKKYTLVAGNTRLMVARMLGIKPKVVIVKMVWNKSS
jgi:hypothetical protein